MGAGLHPIDDQKARASTALDIWYANPSGDNRAVRGSWYDSEIADMHAALELQTDADALIALGVELESDMSTQELDARNLATMFLLRNKLGKGK